MSQFSPVCHISTLTYAWTLRHEGLNASTAPGRAKGACTHPQICTSLLFPLLWEPLVLAQALSGHSSQRRDAPCQHPWTHPCTSRINSVSCETEAPPLLLEGICSLSPVHRRKFYFCQCLKGACRESSPAQRVPVWHHSAQRVLCPDLRFHVQIVPISQHLFLVACLKSFPWTNCFGKD